MTAAVYDAKPSWLSLVFRRFLVWIYHSHGWTATGEVPFPRKFVIIAAPHTSNWDFLYFIGLTHDLGVRPHFMAKQSLFRWPFKHFLLQMGGVPVDRTSQNNYVQQMADEFSKRDEFMLTVAPEGTRANVRHWKTGFYHIAMAAGVPIVCGLMDYAKKTGGLGPAIMPTGDYKADMQRIISYYTSVTARHPELAVVEIIANEE